MNDADDRLGETELHRIAVRKGRRTIAQCVADGACSAKRNHGRGVDATRPAGVDIDAQRADGATALFLAVGMRHFDEVRELLRLQADVTLKAWGWSWPPDWNWPQEPEVTRTATRADGSIRSRRRHGHDVDMPWGRVAATPRPRRGHAVETSPTPRPRRG